MAGRRAVELVLTEVERSDLAGLAARRSTAQAFALRAPIVLACAAGTRNRDMATKLNLGQHTVGRWRRRFAEQRIAALRDEARPGAPRTVEDERIEALVTATLESVPKNAIHWSSRGIARSSGLSVSTVQGVWRAFGSQPHRLETFKLFTDPDFVAIASWRSDCEAAGGGATGGVRDVVGLYMAPPDRALLLCVDEKRQIQALDRS